MSRNVQRVKALEKGKDDGASIGDLLDLLGDDRLWTVKVRSAVLQSLDALCKTGCASGHRGTQNATAEDV